MPGGSDPLISLTWQPVPGAPGALIYPLIRKIDAISSNSYLIQTDDVILLIDPGGLVEQSAQLAQVIEEIRQEKDRPIFVFLTHAHVDHFWGSLSIPAFADAKAVVFAVQERGAAALEEGEEKLTQADLLGLKIAPFRIGLHLLTREWSGPDSSMSRTFSNGAAVTITRKQTSGGLVQEQLRFGSGPVLDVYHTPGHSPDSICLKMGGLLCIGDVLFAASPGIAGVCGWDQPVLIRSLDGCESLIAEGWIDIVLPGHGRMIMADDAKRMISKIRSDAQELENIAEMNSTRARETAAFAQDCMEQINELFTIMAGRLYYVSFVMDELGEAGVAEALSSLIRGDAIDELLDTFRSFSEEHQKKGNVDLHLVLKAGQVISRLEQSFDRAELVHIIDPSLVRRAARLLSDYTTMLRGFSPPCELVECDLILHLKALVTGLSVPSCSDDDLLSSADDDSAFIGQLLKRIGMQPLLSAVEFSYSSAENRLMVVIDHDDISDVIIYILEDLVGSGATSISLRVERSKDAAVVTISGTGCSAPCGTGQVRGFLERLSRRAGGTLLFNEKGDVREYAVAICRSG